MMKNYSKAIAAVVGGIVTLLGAWGVDASWLTPELTAAVATGVSGLIVYMAPPNKPT